MSAEQNPPQPAADNPALGFGRVVMVCKKQPTKDAFVALNGGWFTLIVGMGILFVASFVIIFLIMANVFGLNAAAAQPAPMYKRQIVLVFSFLIALAPVAVLMLRSWNYAKALKIELREKGIVIKTKPKTIAQPFGQIKAIYFGTQTKGINDLFKIMNAIRPVKSAYASEQLASRLTFEFKDGESIRIHGCDSVFKPKTIRAMIKKIVGVRPGVFKKTTG